MHTRPMLLATPQPNDRLTAVVYGQRINITVIEYLGSGWILARPSGSDAGKLELHETDHELSAA